MHKLFDLQSQFFQTPTLPPTNNKIVVELYT